MRSKFLEILDFIKEDRVLITPWIEPSSSKSPIFKRIKSIKGSKKESKITTLKESFMHKI